MLCEKCGKLPAGVHFTKVINGAQSEMYLCSSCASNMGYLSSSPLFGKSLFGFDSIKETSCPSCGQSLAQFNSHRRMGCENCYSHFDNILENVISKIQYGKRHVGKIPKGASPAISLSRELDSLKEQLGDAIKAEEYEKAATIRDRIKEIEAQKGGDAK